MFDSHKAAPFLRRFQHAHKACFMNVPFITSLKKCWLILYHHLSWFCITRFQKCIFFVQTKRHSIDPSHSQPTTQPTHQTTLLPPYRTWQGPPTPPSKESWTCCHTSVGGEWMPWIVMTCGAPARCGTFFFGETERLILYNLWTHICFWYISSFLGSAC